MDGYHPVRPVTVSHTIAAAPNTVYAIVHDSKRDPDWCRNVDRVEQTKGKHPEVGAKYRYLQHLGRDKRTFEGTIEVMEMEPTHIVWRVEDRFQVRAIDLRIKPHRAGCKVTQTTRATFKRPPGIYRVLYPLMAKRVLKQQLRDLAKLVQR